MSLLTAPDPISSHEDFLFRWLPIFAKPSLLGLLVPSGATLAAFLSGLQVTAKSDARTLEAESFLEDSCSGCILLSLGDLLGFPIDDLVGEVDCGKGLLNLGDLLGLPTDVFVGETDKSLSSSIVSM